MRDAALLEARCRAAVSGEAEAPLNDAQLNAIADGSATLGEGVASDAARRANLARLWHDNRHELQRTIEETRPGGLLPVDAAASMAHLRQHAGLAARGAEAHRAEAEGAPAEPTAATVAAQQLAAGKAFMLDALYTRLLGIWYDALVLWTNAGTVEKQPVPAVPGVAACRGADDAVEAAFIRAAATTAVAAFAAARSADAAYSFSAIAADPTLTPFQGGARDAAKRAWAAALLAEKRAHYACETSDATIAVAAARAAVAGAAAGAPPPAPECSAAVESDVEEEDESDIDI